MQVMLPKEKVEYAPRFRLPEVFISSIFRGMEIILNNQPKEIATQCSVQHLLNEMLGEKQKGIAVAVNNTVIPKINWAIVSLNVNDEVLIIKATQGG